MAKTCISKRKEMHMAASQKKWVRSVKTDSTHPPEGLFKKDPETIARTLASKKVSPKGPGSGMRMLTYFINRAGKGLSARQKARLEKAETLLSERAGRAHEKEKKRAA
jgi:hypothetical protein